LFGAVKECCRESGIENPVIQFRYAGPEREETIG